MEKEKKKRFWEQTIQSEVPIRMRTYRCPVCNEVLFSVPDDLPVSREKVEMVCKNGHKVRVPKFES